MEEAELLKERLQAITDKRRIQEDIAKKRRQIEEEKLKLQYIKKKALRDQWLMDGVSQQSEEEQEASRIQAQEEQQQSDELQSNIHRIEKEIEALESQELNISANEEVVLKRLKEVERTAEDIIKEINADFHADVTQHLCSPDISSCIPLRAVKAPPACEPGDAPRKATFVMEISVEHDRRTGKCEVVSTATITPETIQEGGLKVYEDGRKSVYAMCSDGVEAQNPAVAEMTGLEVEELLRQATERKVLMEVQYHQPVYAVPYTATSRSTTPRTPNKTLRPRAAASGSEILREEEQEEHISSKKASSPLLFPQDSTSRAQTPGQEAKRPCFNNNAKTSPGPNQSKSEPSTPVALVSIKARSEGICEATQPVYRAVGGRSPSSASHKSDISTESLCDPCRLSPFCARSISPLNLVSSLPDVTEPVTMVFMGYENAVDEEEDIQAELVVIGNSDYEDDCDQYVEDESDTEDYLSYHPQGYKSRVFQPVVGRAEVVSSTDISENGYTGCEDLGLHKPKFIHKPGRNMQGQDVEEPADTGSINLEKMKLCSTAR